MRNVCFSYPYGNMKEVGEAAMEMVRSLGYPCAVSNTNAAGGDHSIWFLPRMSVPADKFMLHFELSGLKYFIKNRKLLPVA